MATGPFGSWPSPLTAAEVASADVRLHEPELGYDGSVWWLERRAQEGGRVALVRDGEDVLPEDANVRTQAHEYGGGSWLLGGDTVFFSNWEDQRLYRLDRGGEPRPITPDARCRYADGRVTSDGARVICVRESHEGDEVVNEVVSVPATGDGDPEVLAAGHDFYSFPRLSRDGERLCFT